MIHSVAVIGIGAMGAPMARRVLAGGFALTVCDRDPVPLRAFAEAGACVARRAADCAAADLVIVLVATEEQACQVLLGEDGLVAGLMSLSGAGRPLVALMDTLSAGAVRDIARSLDTHGVRVIDAPVSGGVIRAEKGDLTIITGGDPEDARAAESVFDCLGPQRFHCGALGAAQTMKILNNILGIANAVFSAETYRLALEYGLDPAHVARVLETGTGRNFLSADPAGPQATFAAMTKGRDGFDALVAVMRKDLELAASMASHAGGAYPAIDGLKALLGGMDAEAFSNWRRVACG